MKEYIMKNIILVTSILLFSGNLNAQKKGHSISLNVPQMANEEFYLAYHYEEKQFIADTLTFNNKGQLMIKGDENLPHGVYLAVFPRLKNKYFEFIVKNQYFGIELPDTNNFDNVIFSNSLDNEIFQFDMNEMKNIRQQSQVLEGKIKLAQEDEEKKALTAEYTQLNKDFTANRVAIMEENPELLYSAILGMLREIKIPEPPVDENGVEVDPNFRFHYFKQHYWDYTFFNEEGIIRTPVLKGKLIDYFDKYTVKNQDSIIQSCDIVLEKAMANPNVFQYALVTLLNKYANSKVMGDDAVYVHLVKNYYEAGETPWIDSVQLDKMIERRKAIEPLLIGKTSPNLSLRDTSINKYYSLHDIKTDYTVLYIWDPDCGHCKKVTPKLGAFYKNHLDESLSVYAITTSNIEQIEEWKSFIKTHDLNWINVSDLYHQTNFRTIYDVTSTPQIFILDKAKKIIAKRIAVEQLEGFFHQYMKNEGDENYENFIFNEDTFDAEEEHSEGDGHGH